MAGGTRNPILMSKNCNIHDLASLDRKSWTPGLDSPEQSVIWDRFCYSFAILQMLEIHFLIKIRNISLSLALQYRLLKQPSELDLLFINCSLILITQ